MPTASQAPYSISVEPTTARVRVNIDGQVVADSPGALLLRESFSPTHCYFPKHDLIEGLLDPSPVRAFCPFKGTAHYWHLRLPDGTVEDGAWSYETPLPEARAVGGYVAFDPRKIDGIVADPPLPLETIQPMGGRPLIDWLLQHAWLCQTPAELTEQFATQLVAGGVPLWRMAVNLWTLHPEIAGRRLTWVRGVDGIAESDTPHGILQSPAYRNSPVRFVSEGLGGVRQRLDVDEPEFQFPILEELRSSGGTDYVAIPLPFSDGRFQTMTLATDHPDGFTTAQLGQVFGAFFVLGRFYEVLTLRRNAAVLFDTYLGERPRQQVLGGLTQRGAGQVIQAVVLYCDLRDSTSLAETLPRETYLGLLNDFFECAVEPVLANGGEVLKFIGDAVLAIFPPEGEDEDKAVERACLKACEAAQAIVAGIEALPPRSDRPPIRCAIGLDLGEVMFGNVGAPRRLDFTVIGQAANVAARLSGLCKELEQPLLASSAVAEHVPEDLRCLGSRKMRNVAEEVEVFAIAGTDFG